MAGILSRRTSWLWIAVFVASIAYFSPWIVSSDTGLTFGAYDLAEWASLHPVVRTALLLITSLLLRGQVVLLNAIIALHLPRLFDTPRWWLSMFAVTLAATALLPPLEFFSEMQGDGNYQQQFGLAVIAFVMGILCLSKVIIRWRRIIVLTLAATGVITSAIAVFQAVQLLDQFRVDPHLGIGGILWIGIYLVVGFASIKSKPKSKQGSA